MESDMMPLFQWLFWVEIYKYREWLSMLEKDCRVTTRT